MAVTYSWKQFKDDLTEIEPFLEEVRQSGDRLKSRIDTVIKEMGRTGTTLIVGSTNPDRLTTVIDSRTPDARYPADFDIGLILDQPFDDEEELAIHRKLFPDGETKRKYGRNELFAYHGKFPVGLVIVSPEEASELLPILYSTTQHFNQDEIYNTRAMRLLTMRNGAYGGYTQGLKGIALEQMVKNHGDFDMVLNWLAEEIRHHSPQKIDVPNPVFEGRNLVDRVQDDVWKRVLAAANAYVQKGLIKASPFTIESWQETHPGHSTFTHHTTMDDADKVYRTSKRFADRALSEVQRDFGEEPSSCDCNLFVIPSLRSTDLFVGSSFPTDGARSREFRDKFERRWYNSIVNEERTEQG